MRSSTLVLLSAVCALALLSVACASASSVVQRSGDPGADSESSLPALGAHQLTESELRAMGSRLQGLQSQVTSVTQQMDSFLDAHRSDSSVLTDSHEQVAALQAKLEALMHTQEELEQRHQKALETDHQNLLQLIDTQTKQQEMIMQEMTRNKQLEAELTDLKLKSEAAANQQSFARELASSQGLEHQIEQQHEQLVAEDGSFLEISTERPIRQARQQLRSNGRRGPQSDLQAAEEEAQLLMEAASEQRLGAEAAAEFGADEQQQQQQQPRRPSNNPAAYASSAEYMEATSGFEDPSSRSSSSSMSPQQLAAFSAGMGSESDSASHAPLPGQASRRSMSEIDSLINEGSQSSDLAGSGSGSELEFNPSALHNPSLKHDLSMLQDEDAIQKAMLRAQAKIQAIAAELEKHNLANGGDHSAGIEIEMEEIGGDEQAQQHF